MRKVSLALAIAAMVIFTFGCAYTNYPVIEDDDQTNSSVGNHIVNTSGQSLIVPEIQVATIYADGTDNLHSWVNQDGAGNQTIYTRNNYCAAGEPCQAFPFAGLTFLNDDRTGCWIWKAPNPVVDDVDIFDGDFNANCDGARSLKVRLSTTARFMEAGNDGGPGSAGQGGGSGLSQVFGGGVGIREAIAALGRLDEVGLYGEYPEYGLTGWKFTLTPDNFEAWLGNDRFMYDGVVAVFDARNRNLALDARTGNAGDMLRQLADWIDANGDRGSLSVTFLGVTATFDVGFMGSDHYRDLADRTL